MSINAKSIGDVFATSPAFISLFQYLNKRPGLRRSTRFKHLMEAFSAAMEEAPEKTEYFERAKERITLIYNHDCATLCDLSMTSWKCEVDTLGLYVFKWDTLGWEL